MSGVEGLVSVIMPAFNAGHFLAKAVASIERQGYPQLEIIVVDDGSSDDTAAVAQALPGVTLIQQKNSGPAAARNRGIEASRGDFIAFLDADDEWPAGKLDLQLGRFRAQPDLDVVLGRIQYIALPGGEMADLRFETEDNTITHVHLGSGIYRRSAFDRVGLFEEILRFSEDVDWFMRAREENLSMTILKDVTLLYQLHPSNMTRGVSGDQLNLALVLKRSLERRRKRGGVPVNLKPWSYYDERTRDPR